MQKPLEAERMAFVEQRDGVQGAVDFAKRAVTAYRAAILQHKGVGADRGYRRLLVQCCFEFRRYINANQG